MCLQGTQARLQSHHLRLQGTQSASAISCASKASNFTSKAKEEKGTTYKVEQATTSSSKEIQAKGSTSKISNIRLRAHASKIQAKGEMWKNSSTTK